MTQDDCSFALRQTPRFFEALNFMPQPTFATRANLALLEDYYRRWQSNPASVDGQWQAFFEGLEFGEQIPRTAAMKMDGAEGEAQTRVVRMVSAYRNLGHLIAHLDPLSDP